MIEKLEKLEEFINKALEAFGRLLLRIWRKLLPAALLSFSSKIFLSISSKVLLVKNSVTSRAGKVLRSLQAVPKRARGQDSPSGEDDSYLPLKYRAINRASRLKLLLLKTPLKSRAEAISQKISSALSLISSKASKIPRTQFFIATAAMLMIFFGTYSVYISSEKIYMSEWGSRAPASSGEYLDRPEYRKFEKRTLKVFNIRVPVYAENVKSVKTVTVDFTIRTSTRFSRMFLEEYEYKLKDHFFMTTEPVISSFPLEEEGKRVLKEKIQDELNIFLERKNVEGEVLEVDITFLVGS